MEINASRILDAATAIRSEIIEDRRWLHRNPEVGACLPQTKEYVKQRLTEMGYEPVEICESGIVATITGDVTGEDTDVGTGRCILLRADMDGLSAEEKTGLPFGSTNGKMHACGHDMHTAMLLGAAALLQKYRHAWKGTVKLVFQPDEEGFTGAKAMLRAGVLTDPAPGAGLALHVHSGTPSGMILCGRGTFMAGCTLFRVTVKGVGCHGAMPETGVDPILIAAHIAIAIGEIQTREIPAKKPAVITIGKFSGGAAPNIIPQEVVIEGTIRTFDRALSETVLQRIAEISGSIAKAFRGSATVVELSSAPPLLNDPALVNRMAGYAKGLFGENAVYLTDEGGMGSEDFASYTYELPSAYLLIGAGTKAEDPRFGEPMHNECVVFNEDILPQGAALFTYCALRWLNDGETAEGR